MPQRLTSNHPSILFISFVAKPGNYRINASMLYRCENLGQALRHHGFRVTYSHALQAIKHLLFSRPDICVLHRPNGSHLCRAIGGLLKKKGITTVIDFDDLIFDPAVHTHNPGVIHGHVKARTLARRFSRTRAFIHGFEHFTVSTEPLAAALHHVHPQANIQLIHNARLPGWQSSPDELPPKPHKRLTYFPGSRGHEHDLAVAWPAIRRVLAERPEIEFHVVGRMDVHRLREQAPVHHLGLLPPARYREQVAASWVNLAPLADNPFNRCKSALKMIESSAFGVPTLYSPIADAERFVGKGCLIADSEQAWYAHILALTDDDFYRQQRALACGPGQLESDVQVQAEHFIDFLARGGQSA